MKPEVFMPILISVFALGLSIYNIKANYIQRRQTNIRYLKQKKSNLLRDCKSYMSELSIMYSYLLFINKNDYVESVKSTLIDAKKSTLEAHEILKNVYMDIQKTNYNDEDKLDLFHDGIIHQIEGFKAIKTMINQGIENGRK